MLSNHTNIYACYAVCFLGKITPGSVADRTGEPGIKDPPWNLGDSIKS